MAYADLTQEQRDTLDDWLGLVRSVLGRFARLNNEFSAVDSQYNASVTTILSELASGDVIPDKTNLAGAEELTQAEVITLVSHIQGVLTDYNTAAHRQLWSKAVGSPNMT